MQCRRLGFDSWVGKIPWRREWQPIPVFLPGEFHKQRSQVDYSPWDGRVRHNWVTNTSTSLYINVCVYIYIYMILISHSYHWNICRTIHKHTHYGNAIIYFWDLKLILSYFQISDVFHLVGKKNPLCCFLKCQQQKFNVWSCSNQLCAHWPPLSDEQNQVFLR